MCMYVILFEERGENVFWIIYGFDLFYAVILLAFILLTMSSHD